MAILGLFRVFLAKNFLAAPQKFHKKAEFSPKVGHFSKFSAPKSGSLIDLGHPLVWPVTPPGTGLRGGQGGNCPSNIGPSKQTCPTNILGLEGQNFGGEAPKI